MKVRKKNSAGGHRRSDSGQRLRIVVNPQPSISSLPRKLETVNTISSNGHEQGHELRSFADSFKILGRIKFDWEPWLAHGLLSCVGAQKGDGKSHLLLHVAARYLNAGTWPDGSTYTGRTGKVLWIETEAGQAINSMRADNWGLPKERLVYPLDDPLSDVSLENPVHREAIAKAARMPDVVFVCIDSLRGAYTGKEDDSRVNAVVKWIAELLRDIQKPGLLSHHLRKPDRGATAHSLSIDDFRGSSAILQTVRIVWGIDQPDPKDPERKRLSLVKSNVSAAKVDPLGFYIRDTGLEFVEAPSAPARDEQRDKARDFLRAYLANGPKAQQGIEQEAAKLGISWSTVERAKKDIGIVSEKEGTGWYWRLPVIIFLSTE